MLISEKQGFHPQKLIEKKICFLAADKEKGVHRTIEIQNVFINWPFQKERLWNIAIF